MTTRIRGAIAAAAAAGSLLALAGGAAAAPSWSGIASSASTAVYEMGVSHHTPLNIWAGQPQWYGTGFQVDVGGQLLEVTACHLVCYETRGRWDLWPQVDIGPLGQHDLTMSYRSFAATDTTLYPNADVAVSVGVPTVHSPVLVYGAKPRAAVSGALRLGNFLSLRPGARLLVLGNPGGTWTNNEPTRTYFTYAGLRDDVHETHDPGAPFPNRTLPVAMVLIGHGIAGMSGAPVIDAQGRVVGVFVAANSVEGFAVPLDPTYGLPVGGRAVAPAGEAG